jgi:hypothetical protein
MWLEEHGEKYPGSKEVFEANVAEIRAWNADSTKSWKKGVNKVSFHVRGGSSRRALPRKGPSSYVSAPGAVQLRNMVCHKGMHCTCLL